MFTLVSLVVATIQGIKVDVRSVESHSKIGIGEFFSTVIATLP